ncbi:MAG: hypothetical protein ACYTER_07110 [Planctomycetota bacterium]|jgi:Pyruvate/2-oxoacid:ferredoxin oxidoreductase delta subunit
MTTIICQCKNAELIDVSVFDAAIEQAQEASQAVYIVDDLCGLAAAKDPLFTKWAADDNLTVMACYPRAVRALFTHAGATLPESARLINLREIKGSDTFLADQLPAAEGQPVEPQYITAPDPDWQPWFPLIDYDRCKNCKQCLNFCLFGVYSQQQKDADVEVTRPNKCKTGCPACARVCPFAAIIFPKYDKSPINGNEVDETQWRITHAESAETLKDRLAAGNIYQMLKTRKPGAAQTAPKDLADLEKLKDQLDIPDELFDK